MQEKITTIYAEKISTLKYIKTTKQITTCT